MKKEEAERKREQAAKRDDLLYFAGSGCVTAGASLFSIRMGFIAAGCFLLLLPVLALISSFVRGMKTQPRGRS